MPTCAEWGVLQAAVGDLRRLRAWVEGREVVLARSIAKVSSFPEKSLAEAGNTSLRDAEQVLGRAETAALVPALEASLDAGRVSGGHVDVFTRTLRQVDPATRSRLIEAAPSLVLLGEHSTTEEFARTVRAEARRLEPEGDAVDRLERQRRAVRLKSWTDKDSGMRRWSAIWDPHTAVTLEARLDAQVEAMFHDSQPEGCPTDLLEKQSFLRAHALLALVDGKGVRVGRPEIVVVVDHTTANTVTGGRLGVRCRTPPTGARRSVSDGDGAHHHGAQRGGHRRPRRAEPRPNDAVGQPGSTSGVARVVCDVRDPRVSSPLRAHQTAPRHLVATRRQD